LKESGNLRKNIHVYITSKPSTPACSRQAVVAGLVSRPEDYYYSSARNYAGLEAPMEIIFESQPLISY